MTCTVLLAANAPIIKLERMKNIVDLIKYYLKGFEELIYKFSMNF